MLYRPKMGFGCPVGDWLRSELKEFAYETLLSQSARERGLFRPAYVRQLLEEHCAFTRDHHTRLWALLMLELWFQMWIEPPAEPRCLSSARAGENRDARYQSNLLAGPEQDVVIGADLGGGRGNV